jgi:hypothetical protein
MTSEPRPRRLRDVPVPLPLNIDLHINDVVFSVGETFDFRKLISAKCKEAGLLDRMLMKPPSGYVVYWAKNCEVSCFGGEFVVWADLDRR